jgi:hypothetical protein
MSGDRAPENKKGEGFPSPTDAGNSHAGTLLVGFPYQVSYHSTPVLVSFTIQ